MSGDQHTEQSKDGGDIVVAISTKDRANNSNPSQKKCGKDERPPDNPHYGRTMKFLANRSDPFCRWLYQWIGTLRDLHLDRKIELAIAIVGIVIAALLLWTTWGQWTVMRRQGETMERTLYLSERAYLGVDSIVADLKNSRVLVMIANTGKARASDIKVDVQEGRMRIGKPYWTRVGSHNESTDFGHQQIGPSAMKFRVRIPLDKFNKREEIAAILAREEKLIINVTISYMDGFGHPEKISFPFCYDPPPHEGWISVPIFKFNELDASKNQDYC